ncbi:hypothetical protein [Janthinobacterium sp. B9-8]|uniref:hypothetical protein n=1 Tax=Janthinobacterium sp. B9-8 TaxID=1236179 RepID=UPI00061CE4CE|nr:hypothetical protein [Janthinobacterium sp. B9-8]AMC33611.1 hypothetical protein VN23_02870 [Janthinobacterium sp. B9-8]
MKKRVLAVVLVLTVATGVLISQASPVLSDFMTGVQPQDKALPHSLAADSSGKNQSFNQSAMLQASPFAKNKNIDLSSDELKTDPHLNTAMDVPDKEVISPEEAARRKKMEALGYMVPADYLTRDLQSLKKMAKAGDAYAMVHLGEKYYFELNKNPENPDYNPQTDYANQAKSTFKDALVAGNIRSAGIISELYLQENNLVDAYAWHLISDRLGDSISADWFRSTKVYTEASEQLKLNYPS